MNSAIRVQGLGKKYLIRHQGQGRRYKALRDVIVEKTRGLFRKTEKLKNRNSDHTSDFQSFNVSEEFWALKDVDFEIEQGEAVGIIGRNGAGKSTLLKLLSRITRPTTGRIEIEGRVASLLEVGTGFHPELTGRENIYLNGAILGMTRADIKRRFDEIVAFAEVEKFLDTPVKRYSSGMYMRLAFAVAAHLEPEILVVDEVLAVGDAQFQKRCLGKMEEVSTAQGRTVLFVSHNMLAVSRLCSRTILLNQGTIGAQGETSQILKQYQALALPQQGCREWPVLENAPGNGICRLRRIRATDQAGKNISTVDVTVGFSIEIVFDVLVDAHMIAANLHFFNEEGQCLFVTQDLDPAWRTKPRQTGRYFSRFIIPGDFLSEGKLSIRVALTSFIPFFLVHCDIQDAIGIFVEDTFNPQGARGDYIGPLPGVIRPLLRTSNEYLPVLATTTLNDI